ncbi:serine hydrolase [Glycomyces harbinensis]|uniref:Beta-lactamase n=1 Tax=Glycomyces harbinensis TaxID=58114 RepID=A0A1G6UR45_9ACTN|nr:serine hydrolase [Glycomyces harbinensis]SDD43900.1 Beta-lactamase class A [Glycomyces harbinensis]
MIRKSERNSSRLRPSRRTLLRFGVPAAAVLVGGGAVATVAANASENGLDSVFGPSREDLEADLKARIDDYLASTDTQVEASIAVEKGDMHLDYNPDQTHITASIVKVEILAMVQQYWGSVDVIPEDHRELLERMITESDNSATTTLYNYLGGVEALQAAHDRYGLQNTTVDAQGRWGVGWSSAPDQLVLTEIDLFEGVLDAEQVALSRELMGAVIEEQAWGISAAAAEGETVWLKNGWDVESQLGGLWVVNSIGVIDGEGEEPISMAVLTSGAVDDIEGIPIVEEIAAITREVIDEV